MNKEDGLYANAMGAAFTAILRKAHNDGTLGIKLEDIESTFDFYGHPIADQLRDVIHAALEQGWAGEEIGLVFGLSVSNLADELTNNSE